MLAQVRRVIEPKPLIVERGVKRLGRKGQIWLRLREWLDRQARLLQHGNRAVHLEGVNQDFLNARIPALKPAKVKFERRLKVHRRPW